MTYYPLPDIPPDASPSGRRFAEQVRSVVAKLEEHGQSFEVHHPFVADPDFAVGVLTLVEFPIYRADVPVELLYATWTLPQNAAVTHNLKIYWRPPDSQATRVLLQEIRVASVTTTAWVRFVPKRFEVVTRGRRILNGQLLTLECEDTTENLTFPFGLLSLYMRKARDN